MSEDTGLRQRHRQRSPEPAAPSSPVEKEAALPGYLPLQNRIDSLLIEKEELQRFLKEQLQHLENVRETVAQIASNVDQLCEGSIAKIRAFDSNFVSRSEINAVRRGEEVQHKPAHKPHPGKVFKARDSRLNVLLQIKDIATVYNIFVAILPILFVSLAVQSYYETGEFIDFRLMSNSFRRLDVVAFSWVGFFIYTVSGYFWKHSFKYISRNVEVILYIIYQTLFALAAAYITLKFKLPPASGFIIMCEQARMSMKLHSFWREHSKEAWKKDAEGNGRVKLGDVGISHYLYFLFCPTLLYKTSYPRTPFVRWSRVVFHFLECTFIILYIYILFKRFLFPIIQIPMHANQDDIKVFLIMTINSMFPSMVLFVFGFFGILHSWLNLWAELLQFADREFYRDWWNSHSFSEYYRKWNGVVYDWLFAYIYMDAVSFLEARYKKPTAKLLAVIFVIEVSAIIHEFILACALGYCFPVLLLMYGGPGNYVDDDALCLTLLLGLIFAQMNKSQRRTQNTNIFVWAMLLIGTGLLVTLYSREFYIRQTHLKHRDSLSLGYWAEFFTSYSLRDLFKFPISS
ncbi:Sterol O-acyltransferase 1 [Phlyctochytrium planicorne]|nr:Sterol O-acyltransferase 1 [Phlyctochytrium planicorne]